MKIRNIPFGYEVVGGRYVVNKGEAEIISSIYNMYLSGKTLLGIAEALTEQEVTYFEDTKVWNKNMVSRILADERYLGNETFDDEKAEVLKEVYRGLNRMGVHTEHITVKETHLETQENGSVVPVEQEVVKTYLYIETIPLTAEEAANLYGFDAKQREQLGELLLDRNKDMWDALLLQQ